ncbi:MAG TPA: VCBS repeat-containing protein, partial [Acidimicrobiales bacterium]|nr:VCBS repeat-containing protein [Acidimicrobiales bacterium]
MRRTHPRRTLALVALVATGLLSPVASSSAQTEPHDHEATEAAHVTGVPFESSPEEGQTGTSIEVSGADCLLPDSDIPGDGVVVRLKSEGQVVAYTTVPVAEDGTWSGTLYVPAGTPVRQHWLQARCAYPNDTNPVNYATRSFRVTGEGPNAESTPPTPRFNGGIEPFGEYDGQTTCSPSTKPGMAAFMRMVLNHYGGGSLGVGRACGAGGQSEHKEGRAWDWAMNAGSSRDRAAVQSLFNWLFATDRQCNAYARARRLGMMYIIWNRRMFRMYDVDRGWAPYSGSSPHTDHVHFSLTRDGGAGRTSWYNPTYRPPANWSPAARTVRDVTVSDQWDGVEPRSGDFDGDGLDDLLWYDPETGPAVVWYSLGDGRFRPPVEIAMGAGRVPLVGDFNGDCRSDIWWYGPGGVADRQWQGRANETFRSVEATMNGTYEHQVVGDFNGDRVSDIYWYNPGAGEDRLWRGSQYGFVARNANMGGNYEPFSGDFDGDFKSDIFWYAPGIAEDRLWYGNPTGFTPRDVNYAADREPIPGDYNGDDRTDILWYGVGEVADRMWTGRSTRGFAGWNVTAERPYAFGVAADIDG